MARLRVAFVAFAAVLSACLLPGARATVWPQCPGKDDRDKSVTSYNVYHRGTKCPSFTGRKEIIRAPVESCTQWRGPCFNKHGSKDGKKKNCNGKRYYNPPLCPGGFPVRNSLVGNSQRYQGGLGGRISKQQACLHYCFWKTRDMGYDGKKVCCQLEQRKEFTATNMYGNYVQGYTSKIECVTGTASEVPASCSRRGSASRKGWARARTNRP